MTLTTLLTRLALVTYVVIVLCKKNIRKFILPIVVLLAVGFTNTVNIVQTVYRINSDKAPIEGLRVLFISDIHYGGGQPKNVVLNKLSELSDEEYDLVILGGDIFEECTTPRDVRVLCEHLSNLKSKYGTYFVYGNHDLQGEVFIGGRTLTLSLLNNYLENYNITVLNDSIDTITVDGVTINIIGRAPYNTERKSADSISECLDGSSLNICVDHSPSDWYNIANTNIDVLLSGHTHSYQLYAIKLFNMFNKDNRYYGKYIDDNLTTIISSGFGVGAVPYRTSGRCEYVVINITRP